AMLDAYASPAREDHRVPFTRLMAIVIFTARYDLLDRHMREAGCGVVTGRELETVELGNLEQQKREIEKRMRELRKTAPTLRRGDEA
ncbi:MAG: hypothetical protein AAFR88_12810, partial [Pseudomonadota bacterium]